MKSIILFDLYDTVLKDVSFIMLNTLQMKKTWTSMTLMILKRL